MSKWKIVCDKVATTMNLPEMEFEKGVATIILANLGWVEFRNNIVEQYQIKDHAKGYKPDFALIPRGEDMPGIYVELKKTGHKQRAKDIIQIRTYMMLTDCRFCIYFGEKMELFYIKIDGKHRKLKSVLTLDYNPKNPDGNKLLDLITYDTFDENKLLEFCEDRVTAYEAAEFYASEEGHKHYYELLAKDRNLSTGAAALLVSMLTAPERKGQGVETITDDTATTNKTDTTTTTTTATTTSTSDVDTIADFTTFAMASVGKNTARNYVKHLKEGVSRFVRSVIDDKIESVFAISDSKELADCIATLKSNSDFVAANKAIRYFLSASLGKYLEYLNSKEDNVTQFQKKTAAKPQKNEKKQKSKHRPRFKFPMIGLKVGDEVVFDSRGWSVKVASENTVEYNGEQLLLTTFCKKYLPDNKRNKSEAYQGPDFFTYKGKTLTEIRDEKENFKYSRKKNG